MAPRLYRRNTEASSTSTSARYSDSSDHSRSTAPSSYYSPTSRPSLGRFDTAGARFGGYDAHVSPNCSFDPRESSETYASTVPSYEDLPENLFEYDVPEYIDDFIESDAVPSSPPEFAELFPSIRRLCIRHDDSTLDGNMNLRVDTEVALGDGLKKDVTLFHLRMKDLRDRDFSLRRYCRDSGREVCHSSRKQASQAPQKRPGLQRSVSNALASFRGKQEPRPPMTIKRQDSGYDSPGDFGDELDKSSSRRSSSKSSHRSNTMTLEFSNYAHVDVKRRGAKASKRYDFEYWGTNYFWKRIVKKDGNSREVSYHLLNADTTKTVAHIVPEPMTPTQRAEENAKGGWVPPCSLWITDQKVFNGLTDVADIIVSTGLIALVDDCIKRLSHRKRAVQLVLPVPMKTPLKMNMEYVGPKRLIDEVFNRRNSASSRTPTPLRQGMPISAAS